MHGWQARTKRDAVGQRPLARAATLLVGLIAFVAYLGPKLANVSAQWPLRDVNVYWWGGRQAAHGASLYAPGAPYSFTYPPFAASIFGLSAATPETCLKVAITIASLGSLVALCWLMLGAVGAQQPPENVYALTALALLTHPVTYTLHLGEINIILTALIGADLLRRRDGGWSQGIAIGVAAGIKLTPLIFVPYLLLTRRFRAAGIAGATFVVTVMIGFVMRPQQSKTFWLQGVFLNERRVGDPSNPSNQSLSGVAARLAGGLDAVRPWWLAAALVTGLAGVVVAAWAHRYGYRLAGVALCGITGVLISPLSWTHHWVWAVPLLAALAAEAWQRRSLAFGAAAALVATVFSGLIPLAHGHPSDPWREIGSNLYALIGLAALLSAWIFLDRERRAYAWVQSAASPARELAPIGE